MATGSHIAVTPGSGAFIATGPTYTEASTIVQDQKVILGEPYLPHYSVSEGGLLVTSGTNQNIIAINAGSTLNVRIRRIAAWQYAGGSLPASASFSDLTVYRLTAAPTGGTSGSIRAFDPSDPAAGATEMRNPSSVTTGNILLKGQIAYVSALPVTPSTAFEWRQADQTKAIIIPAGTANGILLKSENVPTANSAVTVIIEFDESAF